MVIRLLKIHQLKIIKIYMIKHIIGFLIIKLMVFFSLDGKSVSKKLIKHYGEPKYYSSSAWGKECTYKIGNKDVRFYVDKKGYVIKCQIISE